MADLTFKVLTASVQQFPIEMDLDGDKAMGVINRLVVEAQPLDAAHDLTLRVAFPAAAGIEANPGDTITASFTITPAPAAEDKEA